MAEDKSIKIKVTTEADLAGLKATEKAMQDVSRAAGQGVAPAAGKSAEALKEVAQVAGQQAAPQLDLVKGGLDKTDKAAEGFATRAGKLWDNLKRVTNLLPGLGMAGLVGLAWEGLTKLLKPADDLSGKMGELGRQLYAVRDALAKEGAKNSALEAELDSITTKAEAAASALERVNDAIAKQKGQDLALLDAEKGVELAKAGQIKDPVARKQRELDVERDFAERRKKIELKTIAEQEAAEKMAVAQAQGQASEYGEKRRLAKLDLDGMKAKDDLTKKRIEEERRKLEELDAKEDEAAGAVRSAEGMTPGPYRSEALRQGRAALEAARAARMEQERLLAGETADYDALLQQIARKEVEVKQYGDLEKGARGFLDDRARRPRLPEFQRDRDFMGRRFDLEREARDIRGAGEVEQIRQDEAARQERDTKKRTAGGAGNPLVGDLNALRERAEGLGNADQQALAMAFGQLASSIERGMDKTRLASMINDLARRVGDMEKRQNNFRPVIPGH